ncbi:MAG TPA: hypothetical protein VGX27_01365 [Candidatus Dormibacteraeota bacterium]|nr:hypothetical protein [Candidatus Dormibacteraeota bacterium]
MHRLPVGRPGAEVGKATAKVVVTEKETAKARVAEAVEPVMAAAGAEAAVWAVAVAVAHRSCSSHKLAWPGCWAESSHRPRVARPRGDPADRSHR